MADNVARFSGSAKRLAALELAQAQDASAWSAWRQESDLFGDHKITRINLGTAKLSGLDLSKFNLTNISFYRADLSSANLSETDCAYADFLECNLISANLTRANLRYTRLARAYLRDAVLDFADLRGCDLRRASLRSTSLVGADIRGVDLSSTRGLDQDQLVDAIGDSRTRLPTHLTAPEHWEVYDGARDRDDDGIENLRIIPASVEVAVLGGVVRLSAQPGDAYFSSSADPAMLRAEIISDIREVQPRCGNTPSLSRAISQYLDEISNENYDIIKLGTRGIRLEAIFNSIVSSSGEVELLPDAVGVLRAIVIQHYLFVGQSPRWRAFLEEAAQAPYANEAAEEAKQVGAQVVSILNQHKNACDVNVPSAIEDVSEEIDIGDDAQRLAVYNLIASIENVFRGLIIWLVKEAKRFGGEAWAAFRGGVAKVVGLSMATLIVSLLLSPVATALAAKYPDRFAWLTHAIELVKNIEK